MIDPQMVEHMTRGANPLHVDRELPQARSILALPALAASVFAALNAHVSLIELARDLYGVAPGDHAALVGTLVTHADEIFKDRLLAGAVKYFGPAVEAYLSSGGKSAGLKLPPHLAPGP